MSNILASRNNFLPSLQQFVEQAVEPCGKGEPQAGFEEGNDTVQSFDERARLGDRRNIECDMSRSAIPFGISRGVSGRRWVVDASSRRLRPDDSMLAMAPSGGGGNICRLPRNRLGGAWPQETSRAARGGRIAIGSR
jgi:hypothetical protein